MKKKKSFFQKRSVAATFGILALIWGFLFIQPLFTGQVTGNFMNISGSGQLSIIPFIGIVLLICSVILLAYSVIKKD